jgi:hypothetical protein
MSRRDLDDLELGRRVGLHLIIENDLPLGSRVAAIAERAFRGNSSKYGSVQS